PPGLTAVKLRRQWQRERSIVALWANGGNINMDTHESIVQMFAALPQTREYDTSEMRIEHDALGEVEVPAGAYWGVHTTRALHNFPITGKPISIYPDLITGYAAVKQAAARANAEIGALSQEHADLIDAAAEEVRHGALREEFVVDILQGG